MDCQAENQLVESAIWGVYQPYGVQVLSIGCEETIPAALTWKNSFGLTFPVLADQDGSVSLQYDDFVGQSLLPWNAIVTVDRVVAHTENFFIPNDVVAVLDSLFAPVIATNPGQLDFGQVDVGQSTDLNIVIDNAGTGLLVVDSVAFSNPVFSTNEEFPDSIYAVEDSSTYTIIFTPDAGGLYDESMTIYSEDGTLVVPLTGEGIGVGVIDPQVNLPAEFEIACFPNPFNAELKILLNLQKNQEIVVDLYTVQGIKQQSIWAGPMNAGSHELRWAGEDSPSGLYLLKVSGEDWSHVQKVVLAR